MIDISILETVAEISVALAGFAGIVATFQFREGDAPSAGKIVSLTIIVNMGLSAGMFAFLPLLLFSMTSNEAFVWFVSSYSLAMYMCYMMFFVQKNMHGKVRRHRVRVLFSTYQVISGLLIVLLLLNGANIGVERGLGPYLLTLLYGLYMVGTNFIRLLLSPLWKRYRETAK
ncbi:MAG: hypothetical protein V7720_06765 [Halioglobus sp.]